MNMESMAMEVLWTGSEGGMETRLVERASVPFASIPAAGVHGVGLRQLPGNVVKLARGVTASRRIIKSFKPDVLFFTGGYVAVPMALAGRKIPSVLYVPDVEPGLALKTLACFADRIALTTQDSFHYFKRPDRLVATGYPVRPSLGKLSREEAGRKFNLTGSKPVLLILGGSKGARSINKAVLAHLPELLEIVEIIHICGELDWLEVQAKTRDLNHPLYHAHSYLHEDMGAALAAADLALSRAGASVLGEYPLFGLPSILVPYPYAWRYQKVNAEHLVQRGAAIMLEDVKLAAELMPAVSDLIQDPDRLKSMRRAVKVLARPQAASEIGRLLIETAGKKK